MAIVVPIDEAMDKPQLFESEIVTNKPDADGGYTIALDCGHVVWCAVEFRPASGRMYCAACLTDWLGKQKPGSSSQGEPGL